MIYDITLNNQKIAVDLGHTIDEWETKYGENEDLWHVSIEDILSGALDANTNIVYWLIDGRLFETDDYII